MTWTNTLTSNQRAKAEFLLKRDGAEHLNYVGGDREFAMFLLFTDHLCRRSLGVSIFDLADFSWRDAHNDAMTPHQALRSARETEGI